MRWYTLSKIMLVAMLAIISVNVFSSEIKCPQSRKGFVIGEATPDIIKVCLGKPHYEKNFINDGSLLFVYEVDPNTMTALVYAFNKLGKLDRIAVRSKTMDSKGAEEMLARLDSVRDRQHEKERIALAHQEQERLKQEQERFKREDFLPPQAMYLQAGKYDRNGQQSDAVRLYELLIEKYPNHALAVQANNRLVGIKSGNDAASAVSSRANAERESCKKRKSAYIDSCSPLDGDAKYACWDRANALCSE